MTRFDRLVRLALGCAVAGLLAAGCTSVAPYRQVVVPDRPAEHFYPVVNCGIEGDRTIRLRDQPRAERLECFSHSVERTEQYTLFFIEFDEQGRLYQRAQLDALMDYLKRIEMRQRPPGQRTPQCGTYNDGVSLVTFVHGWRHNARYDDDNVKLAREVLRTTHLGETSGAHYNPASCAREVVGVYVGWRGASLSVADAPTGFLRAAFGFLWEVPTVWDRKNTAQNVAVGSVRELFSLIKVYQDLRNELGRQSCTVDVAPPRVTQKDLEQVYQCMPVRHLIVGHSYGALIVHNAVAQQLLENVARGAREESQACEPGADGGPDGRALVRSYADLIVLLNPAVEGARYEPLYEATAARAMKKAGTPGAFCPGQKPVMLVITSQGDEATRFLFRGVRFFNTLLENNMPYDRNKSPTQRAYVASEEGRSSIRTLGHNERYHTHELVGWERFVQLYADAPPSPSQDAALLPEELQARQLRQAHAQRQRAICAGPFASKEQKQALCPTQDERMKRAFDQDLDNSTLAPAQRAAARKAADEGVRPPDNCRRAAMADLHLSDALLRQATRPGPVPPGWSASFLGGTVMSHLTGYRPELQQFPPGTSADEVNQIFERHSAASPIWNIYVRDDTVMNDHGNISGDALVDLIKQMYRAVVIKSFAPAVLDKLKEIASAEYAHCAAAP